MQFLIKGVAVYKEVIEKALQDYEKSHVLHHDRDTIKVTLNRIAENSICMNEEDAYDLSIMFLGYLDLHKEDDFERALYKFAEIGNQVKYLTTVDPDTISEDGLNQTLRMVRNCEIDPVKLKKLYYDLAVEFVDLGSANVYAMYLMFWHDLVQSDDISFSQLRTQFLSKVRHLKKSGGLMYELDCYSNPNHLDGLYEIQNKVLIHALDAYTEGKIPSEDVDLLVKEAESYRERIENDEYRYLRRHKTLLTYENMLSAIRLNAEVAKGSKLVIDDELQELIDELAEREEMIEQVSISLAEGIKNLAQNKEN